MCLYPNKKLCGAAVAWKLIWALYEKNGIPKEEILEFAEIAAIATVGDVMDLQGENRIIVKEGLRGFPILPTKDSEPSSRQRAGREQDNRLSCGVCPGTLYQCQRTSGYGGPFPELLCETDSDSAAKDAGDLLALNQSRKALTEQGKEEAERLVEGTDLKTTWVLVIFLPDCHESLAGDHRGKDPGKVL